MSRTLSLIAISILFSTVAIAQGDPIAEPLSDVGTCETVPESTPPPAVPSVEQDPVGWIQQIAEAIHDKNWSFAVGAILMFLVCVTRRLWVFFTKQATSEKAKKAMPWIALGLGALLDISSGLVSGVPWWKSILSGLVSGGSAIALWEALFKHIFPTKE